MIISDEQFFNAIKDYQPFFNNIMNSTVEYNIQLTPEHILEYNLNKITVITPNKMRRCNFIPIGFEEQVSDNGHHFKWHSFEGRDLIKEHINEYLFVEHNYISRNSFNYYFEDVVQLNYENRNILPYLISITHPKFNIIRFTDNQSSYYYYCMINIGIKNNFDYQRDFLDKICRQNEDNDVVRIV
jgi:hypothetical protein